MDDAVRVCVARPRREPAASARRQPAAVECAAGQQLHHDARQPVELGDVERADEVLDGSSRAAIRASRRKRARNSGSSGEMRAPAP